MRDELLELVMSKAAGRATEEELRRIDAILEQEPSLWDEYNQWHADMPALRGAMCFAAATAEDRHQLPEHIQKELRARMRAALRKPQPNYDRLMELVNQPPNPRPSWRWAVAPAVGLAAIVVISLVLFNNRPENQPTAPTVTPTATVKPVIQVALLDTVGVTRGAEDPTLKQLQAAWPTVEVQTHSASAAARTWLAQWPATHDRVCKIFYNQGSGELRLIALLNGQQRETQFELNHVAELPQLIQQAQAQLVAWLQEKEN